MIATMRIGSACFIFGVIATAIQYFNRIENYKDEIERLKLQLEILTSDLDKCKKGRHINDQIS